MTSREATRLWVQSDGNIQQRLSVKLAVCAYGAIQWPWLLRSLSGGRRADKFALLDRLGLPHDWTDGCIALSNAEIALLWKQVDDGTVIEIRP